MAVAGALSTESGAQDGPLDHPFAPSDAPPAPARESRLPTVAPPFGPPALPPAPPAPAPAAAAAADRLLEALRTRELTAQLLDQMPAMVGPLLPPAATAEERAAVEELLGAVIGFLDERIGYDAVRDDYAAIYAQAYTEREMMELADFFESDLGRRYVDAMPELIVQSTEIAQRRLAGVMPELAELIRTEGERLGLDGGARADGSRSAPER